MRTYKWSLHFHSPPTELGLHKRPCIAKHIFLWVESRADDYAPYQINLKSLMSFLNSNDLQIIQIQLSAFFHLLNGHIFILDTTNPQPPNGQVHIP